MTQYTGGALSRLPDHAVFATAENAMSVAAAQAERLLRRGMPMPMSYHHAPGDQKIAVATNPASYGGNAAHWIGFRLTVPAGATHLSQRQWNQYADVSCTGTGSNIEERTNDTNSWDFGVGTWGFYQRAENSLNKTWLYKTAYKFADNEYYFEVFKLVCSFGEDDLDTLLKATIGNGTLFARTYTVGENLALASSATVTVADTGTLVVPEGKTLTIPNGAKLVINGTLTVNGTLVNNGTLSGTGTVKHRKRHYRQRQQWKTP
jgi:phage baseplate assembly protein gpV